MSETTFQNILKKDLNEHINMFQAMSLDSQFLEKIYCAAELAKDTVLRSGAIYFCGNGGSAADAQHISTELVGRFYKERRAINAEALSVNSSLLTAIGNDYNFGYIFARQIEAKGKVGDTLFGISTSGRSVNVMNALEYASGIGMHTILITGGNAPVTFQSEYDCVIRVPSIDTPRIQEAHIFIGHILAEYLEKFVTEEGG